MPAFRVLALLMSLAAWPALADPMARAEALVKERCAVCHGVAGESSSPVFPRLAGQHAEYMARQLADFHSGRRASATMKPIVQNLQPEDFALLGQWFEKQPVHAHAPADPALSNAGKVLFHNGNPANRIPACSICHGDDGAGAENLPRLAGQHALYTLKQLRDFHQRERTNDNRVMHSVARRMSEQEMKAVAAYLSGLK